MQPTIDLYHTQHRRALEATEQITELCSELEDVPNRAQAIRMLLAQLSGILTAHFKSEDRLLYPSLNNHQDKNVSEAALRYWMEMREVTPVVTTFLETWRRAGAIEREAQLFVSQSTGVFTALKQRIQAEENELYPLYLKSFSYETKK